jgi:transcription elongation factor Elf1
MPEQTTTAAPVVHDKEPVEGSCPRCGQAALASYSVYGEGGWFDVVKCQDCLYSVSRQPGPLLGPIQLLSDLI